MAETSLRLEESFGKRLADVRADLPREGLPGDP